MALPQKFTVNFRFFKQERAPLAYETVGGLILFNVKLAGRDVWMLLDNRAERSVVDTAFARDAGFAVEALPGMIRTPTGTLPKQLVRDVPLVDGEARAWATAEMLRRARGFVTAAGTTHGTPDMVIGSKLHLDRVGAPFTGSGYYVTRVHHSYDRGNGFRTHFEAERATVNEAGG